MAQLYYMSLAGVGPWHTAIKQVGAHLQPYVDYLWTAIKAAERRKPVLAWRTPNAAEREVLVARRRERLAKQRPRSNRRRDREPRRPIEASEGVWVVLEPPPWSPEESEKTFEAFLDAKEFHDEPGCRRESQIQRLDFDREAQALLLARLPKPMEAAEEPDGAPAVPSREQPSGALLWLRPNTYPLDRQRHSVQDLDNAPPPRVAPLVRLAVTSASWEDFAPEALDESDWVFLKRDEDGLLRDGTDEQRRFVQIALATPDYAILEGPPGSGKTTAICELAAQLARRGKRVLLVASTHVAVDNVLERIIEWQDRPGTTEKLVLPVRIGDEDRVTSDAVVPWMFGRLRQTWRDELLDFLESPAGVNPAGDAARAVLREAIERSDGREDSPLANLLLESANLVCGTTIGILQHPAIRAARQGDVFEPFDVMILDEASKTTFSEFLVPARHARRWVISGDVRQLSPYVEETDVAENVRGLVTQAHARAAVHAFLAARRNGREPELASVLVTANEADASLVRTEAEAREVAYVDLDACEGRPLRGVPDAVPELLYADLVIGSEAALRRFEHRLPEAAVGTSGSAPELADRAAAVRAYVTRARGIGRRVDLPDGPPDWGDEVAWRLVRSYELRLNGDERRSLDDAVRSLLPVSLDDEWFTFRKMRARTNRSGTETAVEAVSREIATIRRVAMPSILEILQRGTERLPNWRDGVALTDGLPPRKLAQRLVSLSYQHRMHPHISAFPREQFYAGNQPEQRAAGAAVLHVWDEIKHAGEIPSETSLLRDARTIDADRAWDYPRYARRALWIDVAPSGRRAGPRNSSPVEATKLIQELDAFARWAVQNPRRLPDGRTRPWEVAALTFYRGQEALLRDELRRRSRQMGNTRNFWFGDGKTGVPVTLATVDRFQGQEADLVFLSFVKSGSVGFLNSPNRLNVALTRARFQIVLIGHRSWFADPRCRSPLLQALANSPHYRGDIGWEVMP